MNQKTCVLTSELLIKPQILETRGTSNIKDCEELLLETISCDFCVKKNPRPFGIFRFLWLNILTQHEHTI